MVMECMEGGELFDRISIKVWLLKYSQSKQVVDLEMKVQTLTAHNKALAVNFNKSTVSNRKLTKELTQAEDQVASLLRQLNDLRIKNEEFQRKEASNRENQQSVVCKFMSHF